MCELQRGLLSGFDGARVMHGMRGRQLWNCYGHCVFGYRMCVIVRGRFLLGGGGEYVCQLQLGFLPDPNGARCMHQLCGR